MDESAKTPSLFRFATFELNPKTGELRKAGVKQKLAGQSFLVLQALLEHPGEIVTREQLRDRLWPDNTTVDYDLALKKAINRIREILGDSADSPRFIETIPRRGYRFLGDVDSVQPHASAAPKTGFRWKLALGLGLGLAALSLFVFNAGKLRTRNLASSRLRGIHSLAVLPLENLSHEPAQDYFSEGITDALTTDLAQISSLRVISRTSAMQFKGSKETLPQIGRDLNVDAIVEGTVSRAENRIRITAQLIDASSDRHLWARSYERDFKDVLTLQDEVARDIANEIRVTLTANERSQLTHVRRIDPEAYDAYLKGRFWWSKRTAEGEWKGLDYFQKAIAKDPSYALAYAGVADSYVVLGHHGRLSPKDAFPKAKQAALKALELDASLPEAHTSLAIVRFSYDWDWPGSESEFKQAIALNSNYPTAHHWYSHYLVAMGRLDEAITQLEQARELDPFSTPINTFLGLTLYYARRHDDAIGQFRRTLEMHPDAVFIHDDIANVYEQQESLAAAFTERQLARDPEGTQIAEALDQSYKNYGYRGYLQKRIELLEHAKPVPDLYLAHLYVVLNDETHAVQHLERAYDERDPWLLNVKVDPAMTFLQSDPRFRDLLRRINLLDGVDTSSAR